MKSWILKARGSPRGREAGSGWGAGRDGAVMAGGEAATAPLACLLRTGPGQCCLVTWPWQALLAPGRLAGLSAAAVGPETHTHTIPWGTCAAYTCTPIQICTHTENTAQIGTCPLHVYTHRHPPGDTPHTRATHVCTLRGYSVGQGHQLMQSRTPPARATSQTHITTE